MKKALILLLLMSSTFSMCIIKFGAVPQFDQRKIFKIWNPILKKLGEKIHCEIQILGSRNISEFEKNFKSGLYDIAYMNPYHYVVANKAQGYQALLRSNAKKLKGILVAKKGSSQQVTDLNGDVVAFPSPNALGASLLMRAELVIDLKLSIKPKYVKTHNSVYLHVAKGLTKAGGGVMRTFKAQPKMIRDKLEIIYETKKCHPHPIVVHQRLGQKKIRNIKKIFHQIALANDELFKKIPMKDPVQASHKDYQSVIDMKLESFTVDH